MTRSRCLLLATIVAAAVPLPAGADDRAPGGVTIAAVGDNLFGRYVDDTKVYRPVLKDGDPYELVGPSLRAADVTFGNIETPVMAAPKEFNTYRSLSFRADPDKAAVLVAAGFDVVSIANNHMNNMGKRAPAETRRNLEAVGLRAMGAGATTADAHRPVLLEVNGRRCAFLAYTVILNGGRAVSDVGAIAYLEPKDLLAHARPAVIAARRYLNAEYVFVSIHWGQESNDHPDGGQRKIARGLIDAGADMILGHHPHVLQDLERWHGGLIAYSLGNFFFDAFQLKWRQTMILHATLEGEGIFRRISAVRLEPVQLGLPIHLPRPATGKIYTALRKRIEKLAPGFAITDDPAPAPAADP